MMVQYGKTEVERFDAEAEALALSFANTADWHASEEPEELLLGYGDLLTWGRLAGALSPEEADRLLELASLEPERAARVVARAIELREAFYSVFVAAAERRPLPTEEVDKINAALPEAMAHLRLVRTPEGITWGWTEEPKSLEQVLWPALHSAAELLTTDALGRVGQCDDDRGCGWLYLDQSRNHSRRWCSMDRCGNRAKAQRHYRRVTGRAS